MNAIVRHIGVDVSTSMVSAASSGTGENWSACTELSGTEGIRETVARTLEGAPRGWLATRAFAAIDRAYVRVRELDGLPPGLTNQEVQSLVETNWARFFVSSFEQNIVSKIAQTDHGWKVALVDRAIVDGLFAGCALAGCALQAVVVNLDDTPGIASVAPRDADAKSSSITRARALSKYTLDTYLEVIPDGAIRRNIRHCKMRMQVAAAIGVLGLASAQLLPTFLAKAKAQEAQSFLSEHKTELAVIEAELDSLRQLKEYRALVDQHRARSVNVLSQLAVIETALTDDAVIHQFRIDSSSTDITLSAAVVGDAIRHVVTTFPGSELMSLTGTAETATALPRAELRIQRTRPLVKAKASRAW